MKRSWQWNILYDEASRKTRGRVFLIPFLSTFAPKIIIIDKGGSKFESENKVELHIWVKPVIEGSSLISIDDLTKVPSSTHWGSNCIWKVILVITPTKSLSDKDPALLYVNNVECHPALQRLVQLLTIRTICTESKSDFIIKLFMWPSPSLHSQSPLG